MLSPLAILLWLTSVGAECLGQLAFKTAANDDGAGDAISRWKHMAGRRWLWLGVGSYACCFVVWLAFVSLVPLSVAVLLSSFNIVALMLAGRWVFGERLTPLRLAGIGLITAGVIAVGYGP